ncbi:MAG: hypothetical protein J0M12_13280 [Deltaproteobacteria bacterium]|nr:hypothetical protein [Deltaproteobacteria bacterium]
MVVSINQNIPALQVSRSLNAAGNALSRSFERLASGQRINRASDDAAGLAIADSLKTRSRLYGMANRNINDGLSALNIASSTLSEQTSILQRLNELAEQAANGTYSSTQRQSANQEYQALVKEFGRLGDTSTFNGIALLKAGAGSNGSAIQLHTGIDGSSRSGLAVSTANTGTLSGNIYASTLFGTGTALSPNAAYATFDDLSASANGQLMRAQVTDSGGTTRDIVLALNWDANTSTYKLQIYAKNTDIGPPGTEVGYPGNEVTVTSANGYTQLTEISIAVNANGEATTSAVSADLAFSPSYLAARLTLDLSGARLLRSSDPAAMSVVAGNISNTTAIEFSGLETRQEALSSISTVQNRLRDLATIQGQFGAAQSRLQSILAVSEVSRENSLAAESRIRDVDVADETARLTASSIRQQTATQILGLANNQTRLALSLLSI